MDGLAASMAGPTAQGQRMPTVEEVAALLMQGVDPQELLNAGIPEELIVQAITLLEQQLAAQQGAPMQPAPGPSIPAGQEMAGGGLAQAMSGM